MFSCRSAFHTVALVAFSAVFAGPSWGQDAPVPATPPTKRTLPPGMADMRVELARMQYKPDENGPLLVVGPFPVAETRRPLPAPNAPGATPTMIADAFDKRIFKAGALFVIAPREMTVINPKPGKADPLKDMRPEERLKVLIGTLSEAQWQTAGSQGLSLADLTDDQAALVQGAWPEVTQVMKTKVTAHPDKPGTLTYEVQGDPVPLDASRLRLRLSRTATYLFSRDGQDMNYMSGGSRSPRAGDTFWQTANGRISQEETSAYGVKITQVLPSRLKRGELDFASPALDVPVPLQKTDGSALQTLGDVLARVSSVTRLNLRADRRIATLPVHLRAALGQSPRAGDVLMALAYGVTGAYRRLNPQFFLLTDDVEGIGTRFARLNGWAEAANDERRALMERMTMEAAKRRPLRFLGFAEGPGALPADLAGKIEQVWAKERYSSGTTLTPADLPQAVRADVEEALQVWASMDPPIILRRDKVTVSMRLKAQWIMPDGGALDGGSTLDNLDTQLLQNFAARPPDASPAPPPTIPGKGNLKKPATPPVWTVTVPRRVIAIAPRAPDEARQLVRAAIGRGFTEIWVRQTLGTDDTTTLKAVLTAGRAARIPVGVMSSLLRANGVGEPERNIIGQTGPEWAAAFLANPQYVLHPDWKWDGIWRSEKYLNWTSPATDADEKTLVRRLMALVSLPGVSSLCLTHTTPPGYGGETSGGDGLYSNSGFGYGLAERVRFLEKEGYDPVDLIPEDWSLSVNKSLPFFSHEWYTPMKQVGDKWVEDTSHVPPPTLWKRHRDEQVRARLGRLYDALRDAQPKLPLYLQDRVSEYTSPNTEWFGSWDARDRVAKNPVYYGESEGTLAARAGSNTRLLRQAWDKFGNRDGETGWFVDSIRRMVARSQTAGAWQGVVVDLTPLSAADALTLINALPPPSAARLRASN